MRKVHIKASRFGELVRAAIQKKRALMDPFYSRAEAATKTGPHNTNPPLKIA